MRPFAPSPDEPLLAAFRREQLAGTALPDLRVHPDDHMWRFFRGLHLDDREMVLFDYLRSGHEVWGALRQVIAWRFGDRRDLRCLDFAAGFGRATRWLASELGPARVTAVDVFPAAMEFQREAFGVAAVESAPRPEDLAVAGPFDCIVASSFLSHVPPQAFVPWLRRLWSLLAPGGVLLASVVDVALLAGPGERAPTEPVFQPASEIPELPGQEYGVAWVPEPFVRRAVAEACGEAARCQRLPRALWSYQDLWVVWRDDPVPGAGATAADSIPFVTPPAGFLETAERSLDGRWLTLIGWACDPAGPGIAEVQVRLDGELAATCPALWPHESVRAAFPALPEEVFGWACSVRLPAGARSDTMVALGVRSRGGAELLLALGSVAGLERFVRARGERFGRETAEREAAAAGAAAAAAGQRLAERESELAWMARSRFWKARELWWRLRGGLPRRRERGATP